MKLFTRLNRLPASGKPLLSVLSFPFFLLLLTFLSFTARSQVFQATGPTAAAIQPQVDAFRTVLGTLNPNTVGSIGTGRREINWDGVPDALSAPNLLPPNFFNVNSPRGVVLATPGGGFQVSANAATGVPINFGNINPSYPTTFLSFSPQRLFTTLGSNVCDIQFFVPGTTTPALTRGFGAVFSDVDFFGSTHIQYFDINNNPIANVDVPAFPGNQSFSFAGMIFSTAVISRVRIISGTVALGPDDIAGADVVVEDDFIYGEPVPLVVNADLSITKSASSNTVAAGDQLTYTIVVQNNGLSAAQNVQVSDVMPAGLTLQSANGPVSFSVGIAANTFTATAASLATGASASFTVVATVNSSASGTISNTATVTSSTTDPNTTNNSATATTTVCSSMNVTIPDAMALPSGVQPNTVYPGYAPASSITLTAEVSGGTAPYAFTWSNGEHTQSITVSPTMPTTYTVIVTDASGCQPDGATASKTIQTMDISGGQEGNKVLVCHKPGRLNHTLVVGPEGVADHLSHGDLLGACVLASTTQPKSSLPQEMMASASFGLQAFPNPLKGLARIQYTVPVAANVNIRVFDVVGREVGVLFNGNQAAGVHFLHYNTSKLSKGLYYTRMTATVNGKTAVQVQKLVKTD